MEFEDIVAQLKSDKHYSVQFDSLNSYVTYLDEKYCDAKKDRKNKAGLGYDDMLEARDSKKRTEWAGGTYKQAVGNLKSGVNVREHKGFDVEYAHTENSLEIHAVWDRVGAVPDVGAFLSGAPNCMIDFEQVASTKFISLYVNLAYHMNVEAETVEYYMKQVFNLYTKLLSEGYQVEIIGYVYSLLDDTDVNGSIYQQVNISRFGTEISPSSLAAVLHPTFVRHLYLNFASRNFDDLGCGKPKALPQEVVSKIKANGSVVLPTLNDYSGKFSKHKTNIHNDVINAVAIS